MKRDYPSNKDVDIQHKTQKFRKAVAAAVEKEKNDKADKGSKFNDLAAKLVSSMLTVTAEMGRKVGLAKVQAGSAKVKVADDSLNAKVSTLLKKTNLQFE